MKVSNIYQCVHLHLLFFQLCFGFVDVKPNIQDYIIHLFLVCKALHLAHQRQVAIILGAFAC